MHRFLAALMIPALAAATGAASSLHAHAYDDHEHAEHRHGVAAHGHHPLEKGPESGAPRIEGCDPAHHVVSIVFVCTAPPQAPALGALFVPPVAAAPAICRSPVVGHDDVRVHGPPVRSRPAPRAPPLTAHA